MTESPTTDRIEPVDLQEEMQRSYIDYAMSVIVGRALPEVRDGLKPVHRRVLYAMYDQGFRPDRATVKCARVVGEVMGNYHPHGDTAIYDALVRLAQPWSMRYPLIDGQGNFGSPGNDPAAAMRYTEARLTPLAMEMLRDITEETVDFQGNYDGTKTEPLVLPGRFPNLLVNGSAGIAVGMATNMPPHNLREVAEAVFWMLDHPEAAAEEALAACMERVKGPDFPTHGLIVGRDGIEDAYRTGRGSVRMRSVVAVEEDSRGRVQLVVTELPYQVNPDNLAENIAEQVKDGRLQGISEIADESSDRVGRRLVITLRRDAVAKVVLNNLYKHTQLQTSFGCNMLSIVDGVPRTLRLDELVRYWVIHQIEVIQRRTRYRLRKAEERAHILRGWAKALDQLDAVIALIRASESAETARTGLMELLEVDEIQAVAILDLQLRRLAALERQRILDELAEIEAIIADLQAILDSPERQRQIVRDELAEIVDKYGDDRRTQFVAHDGDVSMEDLIAEEQVVVTITRTGYAKRTKADLYRSQRRGGKGVMGATLKQDDLIQQFFVGSTHDWILFFTNKGRVYRAKAYELPEAARTARGAHVANILAFQPDEKIAQVIQIKDYAVAPYLVLATARRPGQEDPADRLRLPAQRRGHRDQPARRRRAGRGGADRPRAEPAAGHPQGHEHLLQGRRRPAAPHGPGDRGRARHLADRRRPAAVDDRGDRGRRRPGGHRGRVRQADRHRELPGAEPRRQGRAHRRPEVPQGRAGRCAVGGPRRRAVRDHLQRRRDPHPGQRRPAQQGPGDHGRQADEPARGRLDRGDRPDHRRRRPGRRPDRALTRQAVHLS